MAKRERERERERDTDTAVHCLKITARDFPEVFASGSVRSCHISRHTWKKDCLYAWLCQKILKSYKYDAFIRKAKICIYMQHIIGFNRLINYLFVHITCQRCIYKKGGKICKCINFRALIIIEYAPLMFYSSSYNIRDLLLYEIDAQGRASLKSVVSSLPVPTPKTTQARTQTMDTHPVPG